MNLANYIFKFVRCVIRAMHSFMPVDSPTLVGSVRLPLLLYPPTAGKHPGFFARTSERSGTLLDFLEAVSLNPPNCDPLLKNMANIEKIKNE